MHVQSWCFVDQTFCFFCRSRYRPRRRCLSSLIYNGTSGGVEGGGWGGRGEVGDDFPVQVKETSDHEIEGEKLKLTEWYLR